MTSPLISIIIPTMNEPGISLVVKKVKVALKSYNYEIIVVDDSSDDTFEKALKTGANVFKQKGEGYGRAYREGFVRSNGEVLVMIDGDGSYDPFDIPPMIETLKKQSCDLVMGSRWKNLRKGAIHPVNFFGNKAITFIVNILFGMHIDDTQCGLRVFKRNLLEKCNLIEDGMGFATEMLVKATKNDLNITIHEVNYFVRWGESKLSPLHDGLKILWVIVNNFFSMF